MYRVFQYIFLVTGLLIIQKGITAQNQKQLVSDTVVKHEVSGTIPLDSFVKPEITGTIPSDSIAGNINGKKSSKSTNFIDSDVIYSAFDSMMYSLENEQKVYLYGDASVQYEDIELTANKIFLDLENSMVYATGTLDSSGTIMGRPVFTEGEDVVEADTLTYNFKTEKGLIIGAVMEEAGGYIHAKIIKKQANGDIHLKNGKYTECNLEHPHYYFALTKAKSIPNEKIISGPLYFVFLDIPIPILGLPFAYIPDQSTHHSGIIMPNYGEEDNRGFYLKNGGYYFDFSEYVDLAILGDIYTEGSWGLNIQSSYKKKYWGSGSVDLEYSKIITGTEGTDDYSVTNSYWVKWSHSQDSKARPNSSFRASVNFGSSNYQKYNASTANDYLSNEFQSSVSYSKSWPNSPFNLTANLSQSQNTSTNKVTMSLPVVSLSMSRQFPIDWFVKKNIPTGTNKVYDMLKKISISMSMNMQNKVSEPDSIVYTKNAEWKNGAKFNVPISMPIKLSDKNFLKYFTVSPSLSYYARVYTSKVNKQWLPVLNDDGETYSYDVVEDTIPGLHYAHLLNPSVSLSFNTKLYGMFGFKNYDKHKLKAMRHVLTPSVSISYKPKCGNNNYYRTVQTDSLGTMDEYYIYENGVYSLPSKSDESGSISFSLSNTLEMKLKQMTDTGQAEKKVKLIEGLSMSTSYNIFADSLNWSNISMSARTKVINDMVNLSSSASFDPYAVDSAGDNINRFVWQENNRLITLNSFRLSLSMSLNSETFKKKGQGGQGQGGQGGQGQGGQGGMKNPGGQDGQGETQGTASDMQNMEIENSNFYNGVQYADFSVPWTLSLSYSLYYSASFNETTLDFDYDPTQTLSFNGTVKLTSKMNFSFSSGYDFSAKELTYTSVNFRRELHCFEMSLSFVPFGFRKNYNFQINIKSSVLDGLKYKKQKTMYDNMY